MTETTEEPIRRFPRPEPPTDPTLRAHSELILEYLRTEPESETALVRPLAALDEVIAICDSVSSGRSAPNEHDRRSLGADVDASLASLGPGLTRELEPMLGDFRRRELLDLPKLLDSTGGAIRLIHAARFLHGRVKRAEAAQAAWRDLVTRVRTGAPEVDARRTALILIEIEEALGHEWRWRHMEFTDAVVAGDFDSVEGHLAKPPSRSARVAWFAFANAHVPKGHLRLGQVQFFSHKIWPDLVRDEAALLRSYPNAEFPAELDDRQVDYMSGTEQGASSTEQRACAAAEHRVFARVELVGPCAEGARNPWAHGASPDRWARDLVVSVVEAASFRWGGTAWKLLEGVAVYHGDVIDGGKSYPNWSGTFSFTDPDVFQRNRMALPHREPTGDALRDLDPAFVDRAAAREPAVEDAVGELQWHQGVRDQADPAQRIALHVRAFERALPLAPGEKWYDAVRRYFRDFWVRSGFDRYLRDLAYDADWALRTHDFEVLKSLGEWVTSTDGIRMATNIRVFFALIDQIEPLLPRENRILRRRLRQVAKWAADPHEARLRHTFLENHFDRVLNRAVRQRNAVIHGVRTVPEVVSTAEPLVAQIAAFLVSQAVDGAAAGKDLIATLEGMRATSREKLWRLDQGEGPVIDVLYGS